MNNLTEKFKKIFDWSVIVFGVVVFICNLTIADNGGWGVLNVVLYSIGSLLALIYIAYAVWLYGFKRIDFDWHLINGHFLRKVCCLVVLMPSLLTVVGDIFVDTPEELVYESQLYPEAEEHMAVSTHEQTSPNIFWTTYFHFIDPGNQHMSTTAAGRIWVVIVGMFGIFLLTGLLVSSIVGWFDNRKENWTNGNIRYGVRFLGKNKFAVVIGANEIAASVIRNLFAEKEANQLNYKAEGENQYVILQTSRKAEDVRAELLSHLSENELQRVVIYNALRDSDEEIANLHLEHATEIYVLGESTFLDGGETYHDTMNMTCVNIIAGYLAEAKKSPDCCKSRKVCKVMFEYQTTSSVFQFSDISQKVKDNLVFIPFSRFESWARKVIVDGSYGKYDYMPLEGSGFTADSEDFVHLVVVGMSKMGVAMGVEAMHQAHYLNSAKARTRITFIDTNADAEMAFFKGRYANLFELIRTRDIDASGTADKSLYTSTYWKDPIAAGKWAHLADKNSEGKNINFLDVEIEFIKGSLESDGVRECLKQISANENARLTIAICLTSAHQAIAASLYMPIEVYKSQRLQQIWVYQRESEAILANLIDRNNDLRYDKLRPFGMLYGEFMYDRTLYLKALLVNMTYDIANPDPKAETKVEWPNNIADWSDKGYVAARNSWRNLSVDKTWSNKYFADSIYIKIRNLFPGDVTFSSQAEVLKLLQADLNGTLDKIKTALTDNMGALEVCEHNRWNMQQLIFGYSPTDEVLDEIFERINSGAAEPKIKEAYKAWKEKNLNISTFKPKIKVDVKECPLRIHPNLCSFAHLDKVDSGAKKYDSDLCNAIPDIIRIVDAYGVQPKRGLVMARKEYVPQPMDTSDVQLPEELNGLIEQMSKNVHEVWAKSRIDQGWIYGPERSDALKQHPCLVPYEELPEVEKAYDRDTALGTLKLIAKLGFKITKQ